MVCCCCCCATTLKLCRRWSSVGWWREEGHGRDFLNLDEFLFLRHSLRLKLPSLLLFATLKRWQVHSLQISPLLRDLLPLDILFTMADDVEFAILVCSHARHCTGLECGGRCPALQGHTHDLGEHRIGTRALAKRRLCEWGAP